MKSLLIAAHTRREKKLLEHIEALAKSLNMKITVLPDDFEDNVQVSKAVEKTNSSMKKAPVLTSYRDE